LKRGDFEPAVTDLDLALFEFVAKNLLAKGCNSIFFAG